MNTQMEPSRPSRSLADWMILAGMFIFLVILSHGQMTTANELKKLNERMGRPAQLGVYPPAVPPPPQQCSPNTSIWWNAFRCLAMTNSKNPHLTIVTLHPMALSVKK